MGNTVIGPYNRDRIALCSADASPKSQRKTRCEAAFFFLVGNGWAQCEILLKDWPAHL